MTVASTSISIATPIPVIAGGFPDGHGREWWAEQATQEGSDWTGVLDGVRDLLAVATGEISSVDTFERACREADRKAASVDARTLRARRLLADDGISYERAYHEIMRDRPAPEVDAVAHSLRRGIGELTQPDTLRRLSALDQDQLESVCLRVQAFKAEIAPAWSADDVDLLISAWSRISEHR
jgi:hypothetical protein